MNPDRDHEIFTKGFESGQKHSKSAPETIERFNKMEIELVKISGCVEQIAKSNLRIEEHLKTLNGKVAKHNEWINLNHKTVTEAIPQNIKDTQANKTNIKGWGIALLIIQTLIGMGVVTFK